MTTFDEREASFEKKFALDEELKFKAEARRNRLIGLWAAEQLGLNGAAADSYAREVAAANFEAPAGRGVIGKIATDLAANNVAFTEGAIEQKMIELLALTIAELKAGK
jgi:hypothetical protein